jgi:putative transposase
VRARLVGHPAQFPWSSYRYNALGVINPFVVPHRKYLELGRCAEERRRAYVALFADQITDAQLRDIRESTNKEWVLGSEHFKAGLSVKLARRVAALPRGGDRRSENFRMHGHGN